MVEITVAEPTMLIEQISKAKVPIGVVISTLVGVGWLVLFVVASTTTSGTTAATASSTTAAASTATGSNSSCLKRVPKFR